MDGNGMNNNGMNNGYNSGYQGEQFQTAQGEDQYQQYPQYQQPVTPAYQPELEEPVSMADWVGSLLLFNFVPCIGLIICIVWAFSKDTKKSKANFCKAYLIIYLIGLVIGIIVAVVIVSLIAAGFFEYGYYNRHWYF